MYMYIYIWCSSFFFQYFCWRKAKCKFLLKLGQYLLGSVNDFIARCHAVPHKHFVPVPTSHCRYQIPNLFHVPVTVCIRLLLYFVWSPWLHVLCKRAEFINRCWRIHDVQVEALSNICSFLFLDDTTAECLFLLQGKRRANSLFNRLCTSLIYLRVSLVELWI
jgi:hypothetical protein